MILLNGRELSEKKIPELKAKVSELNGTPQLAIIQVGTLNESTVYIRRKVEYANEIGAKAQVAHFSDKVTLEEIQSKIKTLNEDKNIHGIIVQLPLPERLNTYEILNTISPEKDVDGLTALNLYKLLTDQGNALIPATAKGIVSLLNNYDIEVAGKNIVIVGHSFSVGKPIALSLMNTGATVTICHSMTEDLKVHTKKADILISAVGKPGLITKKHVSKDQVIVDVGITLVNGRLHGDVDFKEVKDSVHAITPVPGGIGPMTVVSLFENLLQAYKTLS